MAIPILFPNLLDIIRGGIQFLIDAITYWAREVWKSIYNAIVSLVNWILGGIEWLYNTFRQHMVTVFTI